METINSLHFYSLNSFLLVVVELCGSFVNQIAVIIIIIHSHIKILLTKKSIYLYLYIIMIYL